MESRESNRKLPGWLRPTVAVFGIGGGLVGYSLGWKLGPRLETSPSWIGPTAFIGTIALLVVVMILLPAIMRASRKDAPRKPVITLLRLCSVPLFITGAMALSRGLDGGGAHLPALAIGLFCLGTFALVHDESRRPGATWLVLLGLGVLLVMAAAIIAVAG